MTKSESVKAIELTRAVFESIQGDLGLLRFSVESLTPTNGTGTEESKKWDVVCSYFEGLGVSTPTRFKASVDLNKKTVTVKRLDGETSEVEGAYTFKKDEKETPQEQDKPADDTDEA